MHSTCSSFNCKLSFKMSTHWSCPNHESLHFSISQYRLIDWSKNHWSEWKVLGQKLKIPIAQQISLNLSHPSSGSEWSSSWKYWARWRGSYSTMGTISSWPSPFLPELPLTLLQYWMGATSSASQSWKKVDCEKTGHWPEAKGIGHRLELTFTMLSFPMVFDTFSRERAARPRMCETR